MPILADGLAEMSRTAKLEAIKEIENHWPTSPCAKLMFSVFKQSVDDITHSPKRVPTYAQISAIEYLQGDCWHAELAGLDADWVKAKLRKGRITIPAITQDMVREAIKTAWKAEARARNAGREYDLAAAHWELAHLYRLVEF